MIKNHRCAIHNCSSCIIVCNQKSAYPSFTNKYCLPALHGDFDNSPCVPTFFRKPSGYALFIFWQLIYLWPFEWSDFHACMRVVLTIGLTGLALLQSGSCGANVQNKYLGQLLPGPGRSSITILPASRQAASPSSVVSCILYPVYQVFHP